MAGLSLSVALVLVVGLVLFRTLGEDRYVATPPREAPATVQPGAAATVLSRLVDAVAAGDREAAAALAADESGEALALTLVDNATRAGIGDLSLRYVDETGGSPAGGGWEAAVDAEWRFEGYDDAPNLAEVEFGFAAGDDGTVGLTALGADLRVPVWMSGPAEVRRTDDTLVLVVGDQARLTEYGALATRAVPVVERVVTTWRPPRLVVEVPASLSGLERAIDADEGSYAAVAAVTTSSDGRAGPRVPVHVLVNPEVYGGLEGEGAQVVMSHEATHVATDAPASQAPTWLLEGIADYVALRDVDLPLRVTAGQIAERVREDGLPDSLPDADDFDPLGPHLGASYEAAWLVCVTLGERGGDAAVLELYDRLGEGADLIAELRRLFGWSSAELIRAWRTRLASLPGA